MHAPALPPEPCQEARLPSSVAERTRGAGVIFRIVCCVCVPVCVYSARARSVTLCVRVLFRNKQTNPSSCILLHAEPSPHDFPLRLIYFVSVVNKDACMFIQRTPRSTLVFHSKAVRFIL